MKKILILTLTVLFALSSVCGQTQKSGKEKTKEVKKEQKSERVALRKLEGTTVSQAARNNFGSDFGSIQNVQWKRSGTYDEASFMKDGRKMTAYYDFAGKLVGTTSPRTLADLPAKARNEIQTKYRDYSVTKVIFFDDNELNETDMILYGTQFEDKDSYFALLTKGENKIVLQVFTDGTISFFKKI